MHDARHHLRAASGWQDDRGIRVGKPYGVSALSQPFTFVWALGDANDRAFVERTMKTFTDRGADVCFVELEATQAERLRRNETPLRLMHKWPQRDTEGSRAFLLDADAKFS